MPLLEIDIEARYAKFQDALTSMQRDTKKAADNIAGSFSKVNGVLASLGAVVTIGGITALVKDAIDAADHLNDLSKKTGIAVSTLGGLGFAASQAGGDLESIASAAGKLNKSIADAAGGGKETGDAFKAMGINIKDANGDLKKADVIIAEVADKFQGYEDGPEKAALALRLFGKAGADIIPLLNEGGKSLRDNTEYYKKYAGITDEVAQKADAFNDTLEKLHLLSGAAGRSIAAELLGPLQAIADAMLDAKEKTTAFATIGKGVGLVFETLVVAGSDVAHTFRMVGDEIGGAAARLELLAKGDFKGAWNLGDIMDASQKDALDKLEKFQKRVLDHTPVSPTADATTDKPNKKKTRAPIPRASGAGPVDDPAWKILEGQLKDLERMNDSERELMSSRADFLNQYYQDDLISIKDYYNGRRAAQEEALQAQKKNIDREITDLQEFKPKDKRKAADVENKIKELKDKKKALEEGAGRDGINSFLEEDRAAKEFAKTIAGINADLLEQQGLLPQAAGIRFDLGSEKIRTKLTTERDSAVSRGDTATAAERESDLAKIDRQRSLIVSQATLNSIGETGVRVQNDLSAATERAQISAETGAITETESLRLVSDARLQAVADLQQVATAFDEVARATGDPRSIQQARALQLEVDKLAASADLVREKFSSAFTDPFESAIDKIISGTASLKDVFKGLASDVAREFAKIATQDFTKQLFSQSGAFGGAVDFASGLFGGKPAAATASPNIAGSLTSAVSGGAESAAAAVQITGLGTAATGAGASISAFANTAFIPLSAAADAAAAALARVAATGDGSSAAGLAGLFGSSGEGAGAAVGWADLFAKGGAFDSGNIVPFAKGGLHGIVDHPTLFPMAGGKTGLMGEAGPEAIMPLTNGKDGLSITMIDERGKAALLPVTRDQAGRMAVRGSAKAFANGGVFSGGDLQRSARAVFGMAGAQPASGVHSAMESFIVHNNFTISGQTNAASQGQIAAAASRGVERARRNR